MTRFGDDRMVRLPAALAPSGLRSLSKRGERIVLLGIITMLFLLDYRFGVMHRTAALFEAASSPLVSAISAVAVASWIGVFSYAMRRRIERAELILAKTEAEQNAATAEICDALTGLPNRRGLRAELARRIAEAPADGRLGTLFAVDIDRFKALNEVYGHLIADHVLIEFSDRLATAVELDDFVARVGPDEFHVLTRVADPAAAVARARRLVTEVGLSLDDVDPPLPITADVGIAFFTGGDSERAMRHADIALENAKRSENSIALFSPEMETEIRDRAELEAALEAAIDTDQISPHFQPVIDLSDGGLTGFEVLARWLHPTRGSIPPSVFIPIAEETGLLSRLTTKLLRQACTSARDWPAHIKIAVNISPVDFTNPWLAQEILQILTEVGFPPQRLEIEITESALVVDHDQATRTLLSLKNQGVSIALDDFGTGYASLHQLRMLPFDKIKIDQSFVKTMRENVDSRMIVKAIIGLSGSLGLPTTAEGIESSGNADILRDLGCTLGQGFLYSEAVPAQKVPEIIDMIAHPDRTFSLDAETPTPAPVERSVEPAPITEPAASDPARATMREAVRLTA
jgi:diguanylate cyclase (GGDEF)-like protein